MIYKLEGPGVDQEPKNLFEIDDKTGVIRSKRPLDREKYNSFTVRYGSNIKYHPWHLKCVLKHYERHLLETSHSAPNETLHNMFWSIGSRFCLKTYISVSETCSNSQRSVCKGLYGHLGRHFRKFQTTWLGCNPWCWTKNPAHFFLPFPAYVVFRYSKCPVGCFLDLW